MFSVKLAIEEIPLSSYCGTASGLSLTSFIFSEQGGIFVMEPQPWKSYENNYKISEVTIPVLVRSCLLWIFLTNDLFINLIRNIAKTLCPKTHV